MRKRSCAVVVLLVPLSIAPARAGTGPEPKEEIRSPAFRQNWSILSSVAEAEPNNTCSTAEVLGCGNTLQPASIGAMTPRDTDWVAFDANAGDIITFGTEADGTSGQVGDTRIDLFWSGCATQLASDDDSGAGLYSLISICAPFTGRYYGRIAAFGNETGAYQAFVTCVPASAPNDRCDVARSIPCGSINLTGSTAGACDDYTLPTGPLSCTGFRADGCDVAYLLDVAAGDSLWLDYTQTTTDGSLYVIEDGEDGRLLRLTPN